MKTLWLDHEEPYNGSQLRSLFAYTTQALAGDSLIAWVGACRVELEHMVDMEDAIVAAQISGARMVHFIAEKFGPSLAYGVALQRVMASLAIDTLRELSPHAHLTQALRRDGDDIFLDHRKLSISVATVSPVSVMLHFAVNVVNEGTPAGVNTLCLQELGVDEKIFAQALLDKMAREVDSIDFATHKVRWVR